MAAKSKHERFIAHVFWGTILLGMGLPLFTMFIVNIFANHMNSFAAIRSVLTFFFHELTGLGFMFWLFHSIIFLLLAFLVRSRLIDKDSSESNHLVRWSQAIGSWTLTVGFSLSMNIGVLISDSSTAALGYIFIPFYSLIFIIIGYGGGWIVAKLILYAQNRTKKN